MVDHMLQAIRIIMRVAGILALVGVAAAADKSTLRIIFPKNGAVVRPGHKLAVRVTGSGKYKALTLIGSDAVGVGELDAPLGKPPWTILVDVSRESPLGMQSITLAGTQEGGTEPEMSGIDVDVEPEVMPTLSFVWSAPDYTIPVGHCVDLLNGKGHGGCGMSVFITGAYADGSSVDANKSTQLRVVSQDPSIVRLSSDGCCLFGMSEGSTKVTFADKYSIEITVRGHARR
jgi:hypothetical protein